MQGEIILHQKSTNPIANLLMTSQLAYKYITGLLSSCFNDLRFLQVSITEIFLHFNSSVQMLFYYDIIFIFFTVGIFMNLCRSDITLNQIVREIFS